VERFNAAHGELRVRLTEIPEGAYNAQVQAAAVAGALPDLLELDGPYLASYVWQGHLRVLDDLLPDSLRADLLPSIVAQGRWHGRLWSVGTFDSGLGIYADGARLREVGARIPTLERPWSGAELDALLERLARGDPDGAVLDLKLDYAGEWYTYAFSPLIQSAGGDLVDRTGGGGADGTLNGPAAVAACARVQRWIERGRVDPNIDGAAFVARRVALAFGGHWNYAEYAEELGDELLLLPLPDLGRGTRTGQGSWTWALSAGARHPETATRFLLYLMRTEQILAMSATNGAVPATRSAVARSPHYRPGGPLRLFADQLQGRWAVPRPRTPAYPVITAEFQKAFDRIRGGGDVQEALDGASRAIDREIADNRGYPLVGRAREEALR